MNAQIDSVLPMPHWNGLPPGRPVNVTEATFSLGDDVYPMEVEPDQPFATWKGELSPGEYQFSSWFITENGQEIPGYYHVINKL
jgi:hypothetical protein